ncbi:MAG TPA: hypothetical protein VKM94_03195 [Blastocatellia bacterium]|nr:hypothetical protein [Blastocatellia bacterium]
MNALLKIQIVTQMIGSAGLLITLFINYRQLLVMNAQMQEMRRSTVVQHILSLLSFIESDDIRAALNLVYTTLHKKHFTEWTEDEQLAVSKLCSSFSTAGTVLQSGLVPIEPLIVGWEPRIRRCYQILEPYIREMQKPENAGPQYWADFDWLYHQCGLIHAKDTILQADLSMHLETADRRHAKNRGLLCDQKKKEVRFTR